MSDATLASLPTAHRPAWAALAARLRELGPCVVAYSGGVDSAFVTLAALHTLGASQVLAVTGRSASVPQAELDGAVALAAEIGVRHEFVETREFDRPEYLANPANRCYFCKDELYSRLRRRAAQAGWSAVINGVIADDLGDHRPGLDAALAHGVAAPLAESGIGKAALREMAAALGLRVHDKPASPCLSSRVPYGDAITPEKLRQIEQAEALLRLEGLREFRVRHHGDVARIEVPAADFARFGDANWRAAIDARLREIGFRYVSVDLRGFRSGSLNDALLGESLRQALGTR